MENERENFLGLQKEFSEEATARFVVLPIPYERTTTYVRGTRFGPQAILEASQEVELYDEEFGIEAYKTGICTAPAVDLGRSPEEALEAIHQAISAIAEKGKTPIALGGEHTVTVGIVRALAEKYENLTVLHLDAHADLRDEYLGSRLNHACTARRLLDLTPVVQVGIRSLSKGEADYVRSQRLTVFYAADIKGKDRSQEIVSCLSPDVYITVDVDVFDSGIMPSVGTPEPGGLDWYDVTGLIRAVAQGRNIVGCDVVELCPQSENIAPNFLAAKLVYKVIGYIVACAHP